MRGDGSHLFDLTLVGALILGLLALLVWLIGS
jgi:hypothetical protein